MNHFFSGLKNCLFIRHVKLVALEQSISLLNKGGNLSYNVFFVVYIRPLASQMRLYFVFHLCLAQLHPSAA